MIASGGHAQSKSARWKVKEIGNLLSWFGSRIGPRVGDFIPAVV